MLQSQRKDNLAPIDNASVTKESLAPIDNASVTKEITKESLAPIDNASVTKESLAPIDNASVTKESLAPIDNASVTKESLAPIDNASVTKESLAPIDNASVTKESLAPIDNASVTKHQLKVWHQLIMLQSQRKVWHQLIMLQSQRKVWHQLIMLQSQTKSRVAPLNCVTLPRLELLGALAADRLASKVKKIVNLKRSCLQYNWTDSKIVLFWIKGNKTRWKQFVANRVNEITSLTDPHSWYHCAGKENPADFLSRGLIADCLVSNSKWWTGAEFVSYSEFPKNFQQVVPELDYLTEHEKETVFQETKKIA
ncbi:integrase catalytic domain-containing protein [Trichonephila clavipes]|uniref:Integrase catalytic domain-containing protein n=1 Tax=Trichonephila clavipes TaxID=2585209 RepID=A0A8X7BEL1_TRICX|nr:integrase catalytic domain-containing protein [Trichonephila clavipes]